MNLIESRAVYKKMLEGEGIREKVGSNDVFGHGESIPVLGNINSLFDEVRYPTPDLHCCAKLASKLICLNK
jgi:hypothetical protein